MTKSRGLYKPRHVWTADQLDILRRTYADTSTAKLAREFGVSRHVVYDKAAKLGLRKRVDFFASVESGRTLPGGTRGAATRFQPGLVPANNGLRRPGYAPGNVAATQFRKGNRPHTWVPVGSHRVNSDGYLDRKVTDDGPPYKHWVGVHRLVWIEANGPVPDGYAVVFRPGRKTTVLEAITLDALELVSRRELMARNTVNNLPPELAKLVQLRGALNRQINKRAKANEQREDDR